MPETLALFEMLRTGESLAQIRGRTKVSERSLRALSRALERVGLIERNPGDSVKICARGEPRWRRDGPLALHFLDQGLLEFTAHCRQQQKHRLRFGIHHLTAEAAASLRTKLRDLENFVCSIERRARTTAPSPFTETEAYGLVVAFSPFLWRTLNEICEV